MIAWLVAFALTCAIEALVVRALVPRASLAVVLAAQLATHPLVCAGIAFGPGSLLPRLVALELGACVVEAAIYRRRLGLRWDRAIVVSALANAASLALSW